MKNYIQDGNKLTIIAAAVMASGEPHLHGALIGVASTDAAIGEKVELELVGVFEFTKVTANAPAEGDIAYLVNGTTNVSTSSAAATAMGHFTKAQINGDTTCEVRLSN